MEQAAEQQIKAGVDLGRVRATLGPVLSAHGVVLVDLLWLTERVGWTLRLTIEREGSTSVDDGGSAPKPPEGGGVTLEDCVEVSRDASAVLDVEDLIPHHYNLEVSSPGLDRPLRSPAEFARFAGKIARIKLARPAPDGQKVLRGPLARVDEGKVAVLVDGKLIEVPFADVAEANLVFELTPQPKKGPSRSKGGAGKAARSKR